MDQEYVLAIDTALNGCSVGVLNALTGECEAVQEPMSRGQSERLVPMVDEVVRLAGVKKKAIALIAVTIGPGAFTGLRIGLSTARVMAQALGIPALGFSTLEILAMQCRSDDRLKGRNLLVTIDTKRSDYYFQLFSASGETLTAPAAGSSGAVRETVSGEYAVCGDAARKFIVEEGLEENRLITGCELVNPCVLAAAGLEAFRDDPAEYPPEALYIRDAEVSISKKSRRVIEA